MRVGTAEETIRELARHLAPVRPIPALRWVLAAALALALAALGTHRLFGGPGLRPGGDPVTGLSYLGTLTGLALLGFGALTAVLAGAVPGREGHARLGVFTAGLGLALAVLGGLWGVAGSEVDAASEGFGIAPACVVRALALGAAPTLLACAFVLYAALRRPTTGAAFALAGSVALGAACVHATCPSNSSLHWMVSHFLLPLAAALVLAAPLAPLLALRARRV